ncbi:DUF1129 family protein [Ornithinibacillus sp. L9]|uniref:DUF1129 family protein n=1 Tax=Ornithinibacillus caprae TaxID=2678566 RepID=A0A6N8FK26_9BACI|nr:DUF1129 family protein [Ornithinibacillus caprae]MUK89743.1 DUF1129 family protein [Ornithinibacillus caprae]
MKVNEIIEWNNKKREELTDENKRIYEDMVVYIRASSNKSEQQTEEVLLELLEHLIHAQNEGKSAIEIFGANIKAYCDEIIQEIPGEKQKKKIGFGVFLALQYIAIISFVTGFIGFGLHYFFEIGSGGFTFSLISGIIIIAIYLLLLYLFIKVVMKWIQNSIFKKRKKWLEFLQLWIFCTLYFGLYYVTPKIIPTLGTTITVPILSIGLIGGALYIGTFIVNKKVHITK